MFADREQRQEGLEDAGLGFVLRPRARFRVFGADPAEIFDRERPRFFLWVPVLLGVGIGLYFRLTVEPGLGLSLALPVLGFGLWLMARRAGYVASILAAAVLLIACGFALIKVRTEWVRAPVLDRPMWAADVTGRVLRMEPHATRGERMTLSVTSLGSLVDDKRPRLVRLRLLKADTRVQPGDTISLRARLLPPSGPSLPGGYDFSRTAWYAGIGAVGYSLAAPRPEPGEGDKSYWSGWRAAVERLRQNIGARIAAALPGEAGAIATALITGERGGITDETNDVYRNSGLFHMLSISGLHMAIMAGSVFLFIRTLLAAFPRIALSYPIKKWAAGCAILAGFGYLLISGWSVATVRSWLMCTIMLLAVLVDRPALALRNVALSALALLVVWPESLSDVGFQMSFAAVVSLVAAYEGARGRLHLEASGGRDVRRGLMLFFSGIVVSTLVASAAVAPFAAYHFHKSQQFAVLANLAAIPLCNVVVMPAALLTLVAMPLGLEALPLTVMGWGIAGISATARAVSDLPGAVGFVPSIPTSAFALLVAGGLWLTLWRTGLRFFGIGALGLGLLLSPFDVRPDVLAGRDGRLVALRNSDGVLAFLPGERRGRFEAERWLEHDGDARPFAEARKASGWTCDGVGCTGHLGALTVAAARDPAALRDDCGAARVLILSIPKPAWCKARGTVVDFFALRRLGTHALYLEGQDGVRVETVNGARGSRPWVR